MIGLLIGSLLLTPVSASVSDNLNSALVSVLSKLGESSASIAANTGSLSSLDSIDNKLDSINQSIKDLSVSTGSSSTPVAFKDASWYTIHQALQSSDLEKQNWGVGDVHKSSVGKGFVILKLVYNSEGTPDEIVLGCLDSIGSYSLEEGTEKCESFYQNMANYTGISCGVSSRMPAKGEIPEEAGADVHLTSTSAGGDSVQQYSQFCESNVLNCRCDLRNNGFNYLSDGSKHHTSIDYYHYLLDCDAGTYYHSCFRSVPTGAKAPICPVVTIN